MKPLAALATAFSIVFTLVSAPTWAQPKTVAPAPTALAVTTTPPEETKAAEPRRDRASLKADARVCLEFPNDAQIVKCSEKYR
jgi:hypothetical protein